MKSPNPCGIHVQPRDPRFNRQEFIDHCIKAQYTTVSVLDDFQLAMDLTDALPNAYIVHRIYEKLEPGPRKVGPWANAPETNDPALIKTDAINYLESRRSEWADSDPRAKKVYLNISCDGGGSRSQNEWYEEMMNYSIALDICLVIGNWGSGRLQEGQGADPNWWLTDGAELLRTMAKYKDTGLFILGLHEYTTFYAWAVSDGLAPERVNGWKFENAPALVDFTKPQWHIGRMYGMVKACQSLSIECPKVIITEGLLDDMQDISKRMPVKLQAGAKSVRGWWTLEPQFREWYPTIDPGEVYARMGTWAWEAVYAPMGCVVGTTGFTWNDASGSDYESFRIDNSGAYRKYMENYAVPVSTPPSYPYDPKWTLTSRKEIGGPSGVNLRIGPSVIYSSKGVLDQGTLLVIYEESKTVDGWVAVSRLTNGDFGWVNIMSANLITPPDSSPVIITEPISQPVSTPIPVVVTPSWKDKFTDIEMKIINAAVVYSQDAYPDPGSNLKLIISKLVKLL